MSQFFHRIFGRRAQVIHSPKAAIDVEAVMRGAAKAVADLHGRVSKLEIALRNLEEHHSTTVSQLNKLRGQVHGGRNKASRGDDGGEIPYGDKEALRRRAGLVAGARFTHPTEE